MTYTQWGLAALVAIFLALICYLYYTQVAYYYDWDIRQAEEKRRAQAKALADKSTEK